MRWLALNVGDGHTWESWRTVVERARVLGVAVIPWRRCRTLAECVELLELAEEVGFHVIANVEGEFQTAITPAELATLFGMFPTLDCAISTEGWVYDDPDFRPLAKYPVLLQLFPADLKRDPRDLALIQRNCVEHAREKGFVYVGVTYQTYGDAVPEWYSFWPGVRSYFTGDDIGAGEWSKWAPA